MTDEQLKILIDSFENIVQRPIADRLSDINETLMDINDTLKGIKDEVFKL